MNHTHPSWNHTATTTQTAWINSSTNSKTFPTPSRTLAQPYPCKFHRYHPPKIWPASSLKSPAARGLINPPLTNPIPSSFSISHRSRGTSQPPSHIGLTAFTGPTLISPPSCSNLQQIRPQLTQHCTEADTTPSHCTYHTIGDQPFNRAAGTSTGTICPNMNHFFTLHTVLQHCYDFPRLLPCRTSALI